jgi:hypothetical protein
LFPRNRAFGRDNACVTGVRVKTLTIAIID